MRWRGLSPEIEGFDPKMIAAGHDLFFLSVVDQKGEHAVQGGDALGPMLLIHPEKDFGVRVCEKGMARLLEGFPQLPVVVNLAVVDDRQRPDRQGLPTRGQVDDG